MTESPSEPGAAEDAAVAGDEDAAGAAEAAVDEAAAVAAAVADAVGALGHGSAFGTAKVRVERDRWVEAVTAARDHGLDFFSWLSAVDWAREVAVGDPLDEPDSVDERYEVLCRLSTVVDDRGVILSADVPKDDPAIDSLTPVFGGAAWHEREAHEMFGIDFRGHPRLMKLYLPDAFEGFPLRKSYPLLSREVKPWPGLVDVEGMPSAENVEAEAQEAGDAAEGEDE